METESKKESVMPEALCYRCNERFGPDKYCLNCGTPKWLLALLGFALIMGGLQLVVLGLLGPVLSSEMTTPNIIFCLVVTIVGLGMLYIGLPYLIGRKIAKKFSLKKEVREKWLRAEQLAEEAQIRRAAEEIKAERLAEQERWAPYGSPRQSSQADKPSGRFTNQAGYLFDCSQIEESSYGEYVFRKLVAALSRSSGNCYFNDGDISNRNAKELLQQSSTVLLVNSDIRESPLSNPESEFTGVIYMVGMWSDNAINFDLLHAALDTTDVEGYLGCFSFSEPFDQSSWNALMRQKLYLPPNIVLINGRIGGGNKYGV